MKEAVMKRWYTASPVLVLFLAARAAAQTPAPSAPGTEPAPSGPGPAQPSTEPTVPPPPAVPPGTGQPPPPPPPAESAKPGPAPSPGQVTSKWTATLYGFAEVDIMRDSTQTFGDSPGNGLINRPGQLSYNNGRTQTTARNSRLGVRLSAPEFEGMKASGNLELDFMGNQPAVSEASFVNNGTFRIRAATAKIETDYVDVLAGQTYFLFGEGAFFFPMSIWFFGMPNQAFGRTQQFRLSHIFKSSAVNLDAGLAVLRPPQRDSEIPDLQAGLKLSVNSWKGPHTIGSGYPAIDPLTVAVSGAYRQFRVNELSAAPTTTKTANGGGISVDAMIPIIARPSAKEKGNALTLTGSLVWGDGIGDLLGGLSGGATFPTVPGAMPGTTVAFTPNIDAGLVQYDSNGNLRTLDWRTFMVGLQYYLPPNGRLAVAANYTLGDADNIRDGLSGPALAAVMKQSQFFELVAIGDITPAVRA
ncbi:MAG TPA: porin, partial [Solirubrobacterales bacterium]|nr:porin [Solirubrobacterales bacterium]